MTNPLKTLQEYGQSVWLDFLSRDLLRGGELKRLIAEDGLRGMTSNPAIFEKAIGHGEDYDAQIAELQASGDLDPGMLFERLAVTDIQSAADALRPVYDQTQGRDGYVSIEVSPYLAMQTAATIEEARRVWGEIGRDNLMVKIPATQPGLPAIRAMIAEGVNINITLLFSQKVYAQVAEAYISGLEEYVRKGGDPHKVASVASFFVSRIDTLVDEALDKKIAAANDPAEKARLKGLQGKIAIANAKLAYQMYQRIFNDERWQRLAQNGAQTQRLLWASTGTKNKAYSDVLYVEELIGSDTVNTMPPATMDAFRDHGRLRQSLEEDVPGAETAMATLAKAGISIDEITARLVEDGVRLFAEAADNLYAAVQKKRRTVLGGKLNAMTYKLPQDLNEALKSALEDWRKEGKARRLWDGDAALWTNTDEAQWLGWLTVAEAQLKDPGHLEAFAAEVKRAAITDPGSALEKSAQKEKFRTVFHGVPTIGGRYSVLSDFGMVPAAASGIAVRPFLERTAAMVRSCAASAPPVENPGIVLGAILGSAARLGRDKLTVIASPGIASLGAWLEQLLAESTGKLGRGIIPVDSEPVGAPAAYGNDRLFDSLRFAGDQDGEHEQAVAALEVA